MARGIEAFFESETRKLEQDTTAALEEVAEDLKQSVLRQTKSKFRSTGKSFKNGVKIYNYPAASYVRLSKVLSAHAEKTIIKGQPNLWIRLPDGERFGFKRIGARGESWSSLKRKWGNRIFIVKANDGHVVVLNHPRDNRNYAIYKLQQQIETKPRINFFGEAERLANELPDRIARKGRGR